MARPRSFDRDTVLDRVRDLFWERGYAATSLTDLEAASGLRRTSLYNAFGNKEDLYATVLERYRSAAKQFRAGAMANAPDPVSGIKTLITDSVEATLADAQRKGCLINNATNERAALCTQTMDFVVANREEFVAEFSEYLRIAREANGKWSQSPEELAVYLFAVYSGMMSLVRSGTEPEVVRKALRVGLAVLDSRKSC